MKTMIYPKKNNSIKSALALLLLLLPLQKVSAQNIEVGSVWDAYGQTADNFGSAGFDNMQLHFLSGDEFQISFEFMGMPTTETSTWAQIDATHYKISFDSNGQFFGSICGDDTLTITYTMAGNIQTMTNVTGGCTTGASYLMGTQWEKEGSTAGLSDKPAFDVTLAPNPATDVVSIKSALEIHEIIVVNTLGQQTAIVTPTSFGNTSTFDVSEWSKGIYQLVIVPASDATAPVIVHFAKQ